MNEHDDTAGKASIPCIYCAGLLTEGGRCIICKRTYAPSRPRGAELALTDGADDPTDEQVLLGELPGGQRRRGALEDL